MRLNKKIGIILWMAACIIGSSVYGIVFTLWFNSIEGFDELNTLEVLFIIFILLILSLALTLPYVIYLVFRIRRTADNRLNVKEYNIVFTLYSMLLYMIFSIKMVSWKEGVELMSTYYLLGFTSLNLYLVLRKKLNNMR